MWFSAASAIFNVAGKQGTQVVIDANTTQQPHNGSFLNYKVGLMLLLERMTLSASMEMTMQLVALPWINLWVAMQVFLWLVSVM